MHPVPYRKDLYKSVYIYNLINIILSTSNQGIEKSVVLVNHPIYVSCSFGKT